MGEQDGGWCIVSGTDERLAPWTDHARSPTLCPLFCVLRAPNQTGGNIRQDAVHHAKRSPRLPPPCCEE